jgi:hypothetical protein
VKNLTVNLKQPMVSNLQHQSIADLTDLYTKLSHNIVYVNVVSRLLDINFLRILKHLVVQSAKLIKWKMLRIDAVIAAAIFLPSVCPQIKDQTIAMNVKKRG